MSQSNHRQSHVRRIPYCREKDCLGLFSCVAGLWIHYVQTILWILHGELTLELSHPPSLLYNCFFLLLFSWITPKTEEAFLFRDIFTQPASPCRTMKSQFCDSNSLVFPSLSCLLWHPPPLGQMWEQYLNASERRNHRNQSTCLLQ